MPGYRSGVAGAILSILAGALIIANPTILVWIIGGYLIVIGIVELIEVLRPQSSKPPSKD